MTGLNLLYALNEMEEEDLQNALSAPRKSTARPSRWLLAAAILSVLLVSAFAVTVSHYGWSWLFGHDSSHWENEILPIEQSDSKDGFTFTVTESLSDERVLYLLWNLDSEYEEPDTQDEPSLELDFGAASLDVFGLGYTVVPFPTGSAAGRSGALIAELTPEMQREELHLVLTLERSDEEPLRLEVCAPVPQSYQSEVLPGLIPGALVTASPLSMEIQTKDPAILNSEFTVTLDGELLPAVRREIMQDGAPGLLLLWERPLEPEAISRLCIDLKPADLLELPGFENPYGGTAYPSDKTGWSFTEIFGRSYSPPLASCHTIRWSAKAPNIMEIKTEAAGESVLAMQAGIVTEVKDSGWNRGRGNYVIVTAEDGQSILYGHLEEASARPGDSIEAGSLIGLSGSTGNTVNPSLLLMFSDR